MADVNEWTVNALTEYVHYLRNLFLFCFGNTSRCVCCITVHFDWLALAWWISMIFFDLQRRLPIVWLNARYLVDALLLLLLSCSWKLLFSCFCVGCGGSGFHLCSIIDISYDRVGMIM